MRLRFEPNSEQEDCLHDNMYCSFAGEDGSIYTCPDCNLEWEDDIDEEEDGEFEEED